jgi:mRNA interferase MazF
MAPIQSSADVATYAFGDVILVPFPFTDQTTTKRRPAVVIASSGYNRARADLILLAVTSQVRASLPFGDALLADWQSAGLVKPSVLKSLVTRIEQGLVTKRLGRLSVPDEERLRALIKTIVG